MEVIVTALVQGLTDFISSFFETFGVFFGLSIGLFGGLFLFTICTYFFSLLRDYIEKRIPRKQIQIILSSRIPSCRRGSDEPMTDEAPSEG